MRRAAHARIERLLMAARKLLDPADSLARNARRELHDSTGLSPEGVDLALALCLEANPSQAEIEQLLSSVVPSPRAHVLLSANVFVAAHRAIALGLAASPEVWVRSSRREPSMARWLWEQAPGLFQLTSRLTPEPGDHLFAFGTRATLDTVAEQMPNGVKLHAHGPGFGLVVVQEDTARAQSSWDDLARRLAPDLVLFDQRGCLSVRLVLFEGGVASALALGEAIARELSSWERRVPTGRLSRQESGEIARFRDTFAVAGSALSAGSGWVCVAPFDAREMLAPVGRNLLLVPVADATRRAERIMRDVTTFAVYGNETFASALKAVLPHARVADFGSLQRPPLDGPVDLRPATPRILAGADDEPRSDREPPR